MKKKWLHVLAIALFIGIVVGFQFLKPDPHYLQEQAFKEATSQLIENIRSQWPGPIQINQQAPPLSANRLQHLQKQLQDGEKASPTTAVLRLKSHVSAHTYSFTGDLRLPHQPAVNVQSQAKMSTWVSILPPLVAIFVALLFQRLALALFMGLLCGSILFFAPDPWMGIKATFSRYLLHSVTDTLHLQIFVFSISLLGMVSVMNTAGGTRGVVEKLKKFTSNLRSTQLSTAVMGLIIFFDDYANALIIGSTMRPISDQLKISREKLAWIVDTTSAPVASVALISTWIGYQVGLFQDVLNHLNVKMSGYEAFFVVLPYRFYCIFALALLFIALFMARDFGPMYHAERRARKDGLVLRDGAVPLTSRTFSSIDARENIPYRWYNAVVPVMVVILATFIGLYISGGGWDAIQKDPWQILNLGILRDSFAKADSGMVLLISSLAGTVVCIAMVVLQRILTLWEALGIWLSGGINSMVLAMIILSLSWAINHVSKDLGTAQYLIATVKDLIQPLWIPMMVFVLAAVISFSIGSSWSTMAILMPSAVPLAHEIGGEVMMLLTMAAVLEGSLFGDNCSPLADTTIMSSISCSSDHMDHFKTQLPYGIVAAAVAAFIGFLPTTMWGKPWLWLLLGFGALALFMRIFGHRPEDDLAASSRFQWWSPQHKGGEL